MVNTVGNLNPMKKKNRNDNSNNNMNGNQININNRIDTNTHYRYSQSSERLVCVCSAVYTAQPNGKYVAELKNWYGIGANPTESERKSENKNRKSYTRTHTCTTILDRPNVLMFVTSQGSYAVNKNLWFYRKLIEYFHLYTKIKILSPFDEFFWGKKSTILRLSSFKFFVLENDSNLHKNVKISLSVNEKNHRKKLYLLWIIIQNKWWFYN